MLKNIIYKRVLIILICVIMMSGGTMEAATVGTVSGNQEDREEILLNLSQLGINPSLRYMHKRENIIEKMDKENHQKSNKTKKEEDTAGYCREHIDLLERLVYAEAKGENYTGKVAVAATVLNRVENADYPDSIPEVIYEYNQGYQYCPVRNGEINRAADEITKEAVKEALRGRDPAQGAISFYNPSKSLNQWIRSRPYVTTIGNHVFVR
ncbi:cell wall hydrolase [Candidatus Contubernalis alkaliaceticus]|uniref:cell wall hydrolase n=1 Tax=Candidatus Contubernalis alkaliaceticus TaxID=338645 RepID=UPI001F4C011B|nr:cell wall hydrolase [Candidatus Contubernalis alkalaceticus]UNC91917.1 cell wall hydrolase [Candidatus Contubernalis alkalaceticus]